MIVKKQDQRFRGGPATHLMMLAVAALPVTVGASAHGEQPGDESNEVPSVERAGLQTKSDFAPDVPQQGTSIFQPTPALGALQESDDASDPLDGWVINVAPYLYLPAIKGNATIAGTTAELDLSFKDVWDNFDVFALSARVEAWKDEQWGIIFDGMYMNLDGDFPTPGPLPLSIDVELTQAQVDLGLGYRLFDLPLTDDAEGPHILLDALGGARYQYFKEELTVSPLPTLGGSADWLEPFIGGRVALQINDEFSVIVRGDASGFGIGTASDLTWNFFAGIGYRFNEKFALRAGYRTQGFEYDRGSGLSQFGADWTTQGLILGGIFRF
ncbi:MAG: porin family protein [Planctomycetota bacterium]|jgi:hypothetical protein